MILIHQITCAAVLLFSSKSGCHQVYATPTSSKAEKETSEISFISPSPTYEPATEWPTYNPISIDSQNLIPTPTIIIDPIAPSIDYLSEPSGCNLNCDPIGSRSYPPVPKVPRTGLETEFTPQPTTKDVTFRRGDINKDIKRFGISVSKGVIVRQLAKANFKVGYANGEKSDLPFHGMPDGAAIFPLSNGYVYVSNSEMSSGRGGVYGVYFDHNHNVVGYKTLLSGTTRNCSGGTTPWNTWVSCEEYSNGQCFQVDPDPLSEHHTNPQETKLGGKGGSYESVACDDRTPSQPIFFVTEDNVSGALRKYTPKAIGPSDKAGWDTLHVAGGNTEFLVILDDKKYAWTCDESLGRMSQENHYPNVEGIDYKDGKLYFVSKKTRLLYVLDLDNETYVSSSVNDYSLYKGEFAHQPDQLVRNNDGKFLYLTEDGGKTPGVYAIDTQGQSYTIFEAYEDTYFNDETTGLAFSPDGTVMYACFQDCGCEVSGEKDCGCLMAFWRDDGRSFDGATMSLKFHSMDKSIAGGEDV